MVCYSKNLSVIGLQWGDEGKGKVVDYLSDKFDAVVRFNGGHNAGHTIFPDSQTCYKLRIIPSGALRQNTILAILGETVIDLKNLKREIQELKSSGISIDRNRLLISENCHIVLDSHKDLDRWNESIRGQNKIGTTCSGIGPCYEDKVARRGIRIKDILDSDLDSIFQKIQSLVNHHNVIRHDAGIEKIDQSILARELKETSQEIRELCATDKQIKEILRNKRILFEGAQGVMLDIDYGTYPFVTSSSTLPRYTYGGLTGKTSVLGVIKAYSTRVGEGFMVTELNPEDPSYQHLNTMGKELGTVTNRLRRCGWFDVEAVKYSIEISGAKELFLTKLDVLTNLQKIMICTNYKKSVEGKSIPVYSELPGWDSLLNSSGRLSTNALAYITELESLLEVPIIAVSIGPVRNDVIKLK